MAIRDHWHSLNESLLKDSSRSPLLEPLEPRVLLSASLPGLHLVDPSVDRFDGQVIYLDFDGEEDVTYNGPVTVENIDVPACRAAGVEVVHTPAANTLAVVDYTITMMAMMNRRFWFIDHPLGPQEFHQTRTQAFGRFLSGLAVGIIGVGRIGSRVGRAAVGLGMKVLYNDILPVELDYPAEAVDAPTLQAHSDIVTIHVPLTDLTRRFINAEALARFKPASQFINCARGECMDVPALAHALGSGRLTGAAIDTHDPEPPPPDYPLYGRDNVLLTPHIAARVPAATKAMSDVVYDVMRVLRGERPQYPAAETGH